MFFCNQTFQKDKNNKKLLTTLPPPTNNLSKKLTFTELNTFDQIKKDENIELIACGENHLLFLTSTKPSSENTVTSVDGITCYKFPNQKVYGLGSNSKNQLGIPKSILQYATSPFQIEFFFKTLLEQFVATTTTLTTTFTEITNQTTNEKKTNKKTRKKKSSNKTYNNNNKNIFDYQIQSIICGKQHSFFLTKGGYVFGCGNNNNLQIGLNNNRGSISTPTLIEFPKIENKNVKIEKIACGAYHSLFLGTITTITTTATTTATMMDNKQIVFGCGKGSSGQLGYDNNSSTNNLRKIDIDSFLYKNEKIIDIYCGSNFTIFVTNNYKLYGCGSNSYGQLANNPNYIEIYDPMRLNIPFKEEIKKVYCGSTCTFVLTNDGRVFTTAQSDVKKKMEEITMFFKEPIIDIYCGKKIILFEDKKHNIYKAKLIGVETSSFVKQRMFISLEIELSSIPIKSVKKLSAVCPFLEVDDFGGGQFTVGEEELFVFYFNPKLSNSIMFMYEKLRQYIVGKTNSFSDVTFLLI
ncbi:hypothetical protein ABK040_011473 [Willaertia magna]